MTFLVNPVLFPATIIEVFAARSFGDTPVFLLFSDGVWHWEMASEYRPYSTEAAFKAKGKKPRDTCGPEDMCLCGHNLDMHAQHRDGQGICHDDMCSCGSYEPSKE